MAHAARAAQRANAVPGARVARAQHHGLAPGVPWWFPGVVLLREAAATGHNRGGPDASRTGGCRCSFAWSDNRAAASRPHGAGNLSA